MKISRRLQTIDAMVSRHYDHIWDCCCDHGHLGMTLLARNAASDVHFVDIVPAIIDRISAKLEGIFKQNSRAGSNAQWHVHCVDVADLPIAAYPAAKKHLVIIAGVGGEQSIAMVQQILTRSPRSEIEFLLCPLRHQFKLRSALQKLGLGLVDECLIKESKWFYEIIHVSNTSAAPISCVGSSMWQTAGSLGQLYLDQTLAHYQRMIKTPEQDVAAIVAAYSKINLAPI